MFSEKTSIRDVAELEELLSEPAEATVRALTELKGDIVVLVSRGKWAQLLRAWQKGRLRLMFKRRVIGVSSISTPGLETQLREWEIDGPMRSTGPEIIWLSFRKLPTSSTWPA